MELMEPSAKYLSRSGYKRTEAGLIPEDWHVRRLGELASVTAGGTPSRANARYWNGDIPWITTSEVDFCSIDHAEQFITKEGLNSSAAKLLPPGTLLMALYGQGKTRGKVGVLAFEAATNQACAAISLHRDISGSFVFQFLKNKYEEIRKLSNTGNQENLNSSLVRSISILVPPADEQEAIAEALSDVDALIASLEQLLAKKRQLKQGAMQELLTGMKRLPGFSGEWVVKRLGSTVVLKARIGWQGLTTAEYLDSGDFCLVTGTEFRNGYIDWGSCHFVNESRYKQDKYIQLKEHDVLVTKDGTIGKVALITDLPRPATLNSGVFVIRPIEDAFHPEFFYYLLCSKVFAEFLAQLSAGSTINHLYQKDFVGFIYKTPPTFEEQVVIATVLSDIDAEVTALDVKLAKARCVKQGMMQELLTGRVRLI